MTVLLYFSIFYSLLLVLFIMGLLRSYRSNGDSTKNFISVIIACKNEQDNIERLITALKSQNYNKDYFEVIFADDDSKDQTAQIVKNLVQFEPNFQYHFVSSETLTHIKGKKKPLTFAINHSKGDILAFTDADCEPYPDWLSDINDAFNNHTDFYAGYSPLMFSKNSIINKLKALERTSIFAVCAGSFGLNIPLTCTARNMAYTKDLWNGGEGYKGIEHILSGDDDLMLHKLRHLIKKYHFSFNPKAIVPSYENKDFTEQIHSETRRTSKFTHYPFFIKLMVIFIAIFYCLLLYKCCLLINNFHSFKLFDLLIAITSKLFLEFTLIYLFLKKIGKSGGELSLFLLAELIYIPYFLFFGIKGTFGKYKWKN